MIAHCHTHQHYLAFECIVRAIVCVVFLSLARAQPGALSARGDHCRATEHNGNIIIIIVLGSRAPLVVCSLRAKFNQARQAASSDTPCCAKTRFLYFKQGENNRLCIIPVCLIFKLTWAQQHNRKILRHV
jgi:hypothetical protein